VLTIPSLGCKQADRIPPGYENSFAGTNAGYNNTTGYFNSFYGSQAGISNTTGIDNSILWPSGGSGQYNR